MTDYRDVRTTQHEPGREQRFATFKATQIIWLLVGLLEAALALRIIFKLIGVNAENNFASFLYSITGVFVKPFETLIGAPAAGGMVLEISTFIAMIVYLLLAWALERIVYVAFYRPRGPVTTRQTIVDEHVPMQAVPGSSQTTTNQTTMGGANSTTVTEHTNNQQPPYNSL